MADPVVILDSDGIEHEFPAGFDPIQAAKIVRKSKENPSAFMKAVDWATEPTAVGTAIQTRDNQMANLIDTTERTPVHARVTDVVKDSPDIISDIASGLVHHPIDTLRGGAAGVMQGIGDTVAGMSSPAALATLAAGPAGRLVKGLPALASLIRIGGGVANGALTAQGAKQVVEAPDIEGKLLGLSQVAMGAHGIAEDPATQAAARATARTVGPALVRASKQPGYIRATTIGALGAAGATGHGNAAMAGMPLLLAPEVMSRTGNALIRFGSGGGVQPAAESIGAATPLARPESTRVPYSEPLGETAQEAAARLQKEQTPAAAGGVDRAMLKKQGYNDDQIAMLERAAAAQSTPRPKATVTAPTTPRVPPTQTAPTGQPLDATSATDALQGGPEFLTGAGTRAGQPYFAGDVLSQPGSDQFLTDQFAKNKPVVDELKASYDNPLTQGLTPEERATYVGRRARGPVASPFERQLQALEAGNPSFTFEGSGPLEGGVDAGPSVGELPKQPRLLEDGGYQPPKQLEGGEAGARLQLGEGTPIHELPASSMEAQLMAQAAQAPESLSGADTDLRVQPGSSGGFTVYGPKNRYLGSFDTAEEANRFVSAQSNLGAGSINLEGPNVVPDKALPATPVNAAGFTVRQGSGGPTVYGPNGRYTGTFDSNAQAQQFVNDQTGPKGFEQQALAADATLDPVQRHTQDLLSQGLDPHEKVSLDEAGVTASKSRRAKNEMSATEGLTIADMKAIGLDPNLVLKRITRLQGRMIMADRVVRHAKYYGGAKATKAARESAASTGDTE